MINSNKKGKRGELEGAKHFAQTMGGTARRGRQYSGNPEAPDVVTSIEGLHLEVKRVENLNLYKAIDKVVGDAGTQKPLILHRKNHREWLVTCRLEDFPAIIDLIKPTEPELLDNEI